MSSSVSSATSAVSATNSSSTASSSTASSLNFESFINLLATELQYQDPTDPVSSTEYVSQMAQLSSLYQMENIYSSVNSVQAYSLIGKTVAYQITDSSGNTTTASGTVDSVILSSGSTYLSIGGNAVDLSSVVQVADSDS